MSADTTDRLDPDLSDDLTNSRPVPGGDGVTVIEPDNIDSEDPASHVIEMARRELPDRIEEGMRQLVSGDVDLATRMELAGELASRIVPLFIAEALSRAPNPDRSVTLARGVAALKDVAGFLNRGHDLRQSDNLNPYSEKFRLVLGWFMDLVQDAMQAAGAEPTLCDTTFSLLAQALVGFEDNIDKKLRNATGRRLAALESPFANAFFRDVRRQRADEMQPEDA